MINEIPVRVNFDTDEHFAVTFSGDLAVDFSDIHQAGEYTGSYEVTPTAYTQTLNTTDKILTQDIIINPIPSNYGLVAWNGAALTIT